MVQKAVEMGVSKLQPVLTQHTQAERVNAERMRANAVEAAEQCGVLAIPEIGEPVPLGRAIAALEPERVLVFCDEGAEAANPVQALAGHVRGGAGKLPGIATEAPGAGRTTQSADPQDGKSMAVLPLAVLIGPEGGFSEVERTLLLRRPNTLRIALGPRILRADTAAVAALAVVQAALGDWR
jgi:16S rRNA (uracil1498-N3)-methyltransferase